MSRHVLLAILLFATSGSFAQQPGDLDSTFSADGIVTTNFSGSSDDFGLSVAVQPDGRLVIAGSSNNGTAAEIALVRLLADGSPDNSFGTGGKVTTAIGTLDDHATAVAVQPDGKIVVAGSTLINGSGMAFALLRYNADGTLDNSFSGDGVQVDDISAGYDEAYAVALQPDGKILVAGYTNNGSSDDFALLRYTTDGALDNSFSGDGIETTDFAGYNDAVVSMALQPDGRIILAGYYGNGTDEDFALARYDPDGTPDATFGSGGLVNTVFTSGDDRAYGVALQPDGRIVAAGMVSSPPYWIMGLARYNADGTLDNSFSGDGMTTTPNGTYSGARSVALMPDGRIVAAGSTDFNFMVALFNTDGTLDTGFNTDGIQTTNIGDSDYGNAVAMQADGKIVMAGAAHFTNTLNDFAVVRYHTGGGVGLQEWAQADPALLLYPNPAQDRITVQLKAPGAWLEVRSSDGRLLLAQRANTTQVILDIGDLAGGLYVVSILEASGARSALRFLKE